MRLSSEQIQKLQSDGAKVKRKPKSAPQEKERPVVVAPVPPAQVTVEAPPAQKIPDYGEDLKRLISVLDNRLNKTMLPLRIIVNRDQRGLAESYDLTRRETGKEK